MGIAIPRQVGGPELLNKASQGVRLPEGHIESLAVCEVGLLV